MAGTIHMEFYFQRMKSLRAASFIPKNIEIDIRDLVST